MWNYRAKSWPPSNDHLLKLLEHYLMDTESGLPQFRMQTHLGVFNPRLNTASFLATYGVPTDVIETVRRNVIGSGKI